MSTLHHEINATLVYVIIICDRIHYLFLAVYYPCLNKTFEGRVLYYFALFCIIHSTVIIL